MPAVKWEKRLGNTLRGKAANGDLYVARHVQGRAGEPSWELEAFIDWRGRVDLGKHHLQRDVKKAAELHRTNPEAVEVVKPTRQA